MIISLQIVPNWNDTSWIEAWALIGDIGEFCLENFGESGIRWDFLISEKENSNKGFPSQLPRYIKFEKEEDATFFILCYGKAK